MSPNSANRGERSPANVGELLKWGRAYLRERGIVSCSLDAGLLLCSAAGLSKTELYTRPDYEPGAAAAERFTDGIVKRGANAPVQYLLNYCEFMGLDFYVDENVLIPRPDTECLAEALIAALNAAPGKYSRVLDIGTGSGCVIISALKYCPHASGTALDISEGALRAAERNARANGVRERLEFICNDLFLLADAASAGNYDLFPNQRFDIIVSNPPYIRTDEIKLLDDNVKQYEPLAALDGGPDGLIFYRRIAGLARKMLPPGGAVMFETGYDQSRVVVEILRRHGFGGLAVKKDLAGHGRVVYGTLKGC